LSHGKRIVICYTSIHTHTHTPVELDFSKQKSSSYYILFIHFVNINEFDLHQCFFNSCTYITCLYLLPDVNRIFNTNNILHTSIRNDFKYVLYLYRSILNQITIGRYVHVILLKENLLLFLKTLE
jgi:hypothetical protein